MPNWIQNRMTVLGPAADVAAFVAKARGTTQHFAPHPYVAEHEKHQREKAEARGETWVPYHKRVVDLSWHALVPIPDAVMAQPYDPAGYESEKTLWGIKWGAGETKLLAHEAVGVDARATYSYQTPWGPGDIWHRRVSCAFPSLTFAVSYGGEGPARGRFVLRGGLMIERTEGEDWQEQKTILDDDASEAEEERFNDEVDAWEEHYVRTHARWVQATPWEAPSP